MNEDGVLLLTNLNAATEISEKVVPGGLLLFRPLHPVHLDLVP